MLRQPFWVLSMQDPCDHQAMFIYVQWTGRTNYKLQMNWLGLRNNLFKFKIPRKTADQSRGIYGTYLILYIEEKLEDHNM